MVSLKNAVRAVGLVVGTIFSGTLVLLLQDAPSDWLPWQLLDVCSCRQQDQLCEVFGDADLIVRATPFSRTGETSPIGHYSTDPVSYAITTIDVFKGDKTDAQGLIINTAGSSAACGVYMELGTEYLIGLYRDASEQFAANTCFLFWRWSDVTTEEITLLANDCVFRHDDTCGGSCGEFQKCVFYDEESQYYCTDFCDPHRCPDGEVCALMDVRHDPPPSPPRAICLEEDPCSGTCAETQTCAHDPKTRAWKWYCSND